VEGLVTYLAAQEPGAPRLLLRIDGEIAGAVGLRLNWLRGPYLQFLGVLPVFQRRGLGNAVLDWFERETRKGNDRNLWVAASDFNAGAIRFYEAHGFKQVARLDGLVRDERAEILLRKRL
jgi:ribosomal protein S18 acetylase RimI-like enzyme